MSRQYNEWYFSGRDDRDHLDRAYDEWRAKCDHVHGVHAVLESLYPPFPPKKIDPLTAVANPKRVKDAIRANWKLAREQKAQDKARNKAHQKPKHQTRNPRKQS